MHFCFEILTEIYDNADRWRAHLKPLMSFAYRIFGDGYVSFLCMLDNNMRVRDAYEGSGNIYISENIINKPQNNQKIERVY